MVRPYHTILCGSVVEWCASLLAVLVLMGIVTPVGRRATVVLHLSRAAAERAPPCLRWRLRPAMLVELLALRWRLR